MAYWPADGSPDEAVSGAAGTPSGGVGYEPGLQGQAFAFPGFGPYLSYGDPAALRLTGDLTIAGWLNLRDSTHVQHILTRRDPGCGAIGYQVALDCVTSPSTPGICGSAVQLAFKGGGGPIVFSGLTVPVGQWSYFAAAYHSGASPSVDFYLDGQAVSVDAAGVTLGSPGSADVEIGSAQGCVNSQTLNGLLEDLRLFDRALSPAEAGDLRACEPAGGSALPVLGACAQVPVDLDLPGGHTLDDADEANLYWADFGASLAGALPVDGGAPLTLLSGYPAGVIAAAPDTLLVTSPPANTVVLLDRDGGATPIGGEVNPGDCTTDGVNFYWEDYSAGLLRRMPVAGGTPDTLASGQHQPGHVATDGRNVYWTDRGDGTVHQVSTDGGPDQLLASGQGDPESLASDGTWLYWTTGDGRVMKAPVGSDGGQASPVLTGLSTAYSLAADGTWLYLAGPGEFLVVDPVAGTRYTLASGQQGQGNVVLNAGSVFWQTPGDNKVHRLPRCAARDAGP